MSDIRDIRMLKQKKYQAKIENENGWDSRFHLQKLEDYKYSSGRKPPQMKRKKPQGEDDILLTYQLDNILLDLWNFIGVPGSYKLKFISTLMFFPDKFHTQIIEKEIIQMKKIQDTIIKITNSILSRQKTLKLLLDDNNNLLSNKKVDDSYKNEILLRLEALQSQTISIFILVNRLRELTHFDIVNGKILVQKHKAIFSSDILVEMNNDLNFIREGRIKKLFGLKNNFDPFLGELDTKDNQIAESYNVLLNDVIFTDIKLPKTCNNYQINLYKLQKIKEIRKETKKEPTKKPTKSPSKSCREIIDGGKRHHDPNNEVTREQLVRTFDEIEKKHYKKPTEDSHKEGSENSINEDYIRENNKIVSKLRAKHSQKDLLKKSTIDEMDFYKEDIEKLAKPYSSYFEQVSEEIKVAFHISPDLNSYIENVTPMLVIKNGANHTPSLFAFCSFLQSEEKALLITHFSTLGNLEADLSETVDFIKEKIQCNSILIDLYYSNNNGNLTVNKDINNLLTKVGFKWEKLENRGEGIRIQRMRLKITSGFSDRDIFKVATNGIKIKSALVVCCGKKKEKKENSDADPAFGSRVNLFNSHVCEKLDKDSKEKLEGLTRLFQGLQILKEKDKEKAQKFLDEHGIDYSLPKKKKSKDYTLISTFSLFEKFDSFSYTKLGSKNYIRIKCAIEKLQHAETNQTFYMLVSENSLPIIIGEMSEEFRNYIGKDNIYYKFNLMYPKLENVKSDAEVMFLPLLNTKEIYHGNDIDASEVENVNQVISYSQIETNVKGENSFIIKPKEKDVVIQKEFFMGVINAEVLNELGFACVYCGIFTPK